MTQTQTQTPSSRPVIPDASIATLLELVRGNLRVPGEAETADDEYMETPEPGEESDGEYRLPREISEDRTHGYVRFVLPPGASPEDVKLDVQGTVIQVNVNHQRKFQSGEHVVRTQFAYGKFSAQQRLPNLLFDLTTVQATYENGLLIVKVAKQPQYLTPDPVSIPIVRADNSAALETTAS